MIKINIGKFRLKLLDFVIIAMFIALNIVLSRFLSVSTPIIKISFSFISVAIAGYLYGPVGGMLVAGMGDFMGAILFPVGAYFPGYTITAVLSGLCYGIFLKREYKFKWAVYAVIISQIVCSLLLNTYWLSLFISSKTFLSLLLMRSAQAFLMIPIQIIFIHLMFSKFPNIIRLAMKDRR